LVYEEDIKRLIADFVFAVSQTFEKVRYVPQAYTCKNSKFIAQVNGTMLTGVIINYVFLRVLLR